MRGGPDGDGSETFTVRLVLDSFLPDGATFTFDATLGSITTINPSEFLLNASSPADLSTFVDSVGVQLQGGFTGVISGAINSLAFEANLIGSVGNAEFNGLDNSMSDSAIFSLTVG
jgi:hypothetical protein